MTDFNKAVEGHNLTVSKQGNIMTLTFSLDPADSCAKQVNAGTGNVTIAKVSRDLSEDIFTATDGTRITFSAFRKANATERLELPQAEAKPKQKAKRPSLLTGLVG